VHADASMDSTPSPLLPMLPGSVDLMTGGSSSRCCRPDHVVHMLVHASDFHWIEVWRGEKRWRGVVLLVQWCCVTCVSVHIDNRFRGSSSLLLCNFFFVSDRCSVIYFLMIISYSNFDGAELAMNIIQISK